MLVRIRVALDCSLPAERVLLALRGEPFAFALTGRWAGGGAIVGCAPLARASARARTRSRRSRTCPRRAVTPRSAAAGSAGSATAWARASRRSRPARRARPAARTPTWRSTTMSCGGTARASGGSRRWATRWRRAARPRRVARPRRAATDGGRRGRALAVARGAARAPARAARRRARAGAARAHDFSLRAPGAAGHVAAVADCVERIAAGEIFQANLCLRLDAAYAGDVAELFAHAAPQLSRPTARASSRRGAGSRASRPSCSCAAAAGT